MSCMDHSTKANAVSLPITETATTPVSSPEPTGSPATSESIIRAAEELGAVHLLPPTGSPTTTVKKDEDRSTYGSSPLERLMPTLRELLKRESLSGELNFIGRRFDNWRLPGRIDYKSIFRRFITVEPLPLDRSLVLYHDFSNPCAEVDICPAGNADLVKKFKQETELSVQRIYELYNTHTHPTTGPTDPPANGIVKSPEIQATGTMRKTKKRWDLKWKPDSKIRMISNGSFVPPEYQFYHTVKKSYTWDHKTPCFYPGCSAPIINKDKYPHAGGCPLCGSDCYNGFSRVECSNTRCQNHG